MAATATLTPDKLNAVLSTLALTSSADSYTFTVSAASPSTIYTIQFGCDAAFSYSDASGGTYFPVGSGVFLNLDVRGSDVFYFKTASTATLYALVVDVRVQ